MKCDELKAYGMADPAIDDEYEMYKVAEVDEAIVELKANLRICRRALWLARALRARDIQRWWLSVTLAPITERACRVWNNIEIKCLKKAAEYR